MNIGTQFFISANSQPNQTKPTHLKCHSLSSSSSPLSLSSPPPHSLSPPPQTHQTASSNQFHHTSLSATPNPKNTSNSPTHFPPITSSLPSLSKSSTTTSPTPSAAHPSPPPTPLPPPALLRGPPSSSTSKPPPTATSTTASPQSGSPAPRSSAPAPPNPPPTASSGMSARTSPDHHHNKLSRKLGLLKDYRCVDSKLGFESEKFRDNTVIVHEEKQRNSLNLYETPADLIIPISNVVENEGFWFRIESESGVCSKGVKIPRNTYKAVLEIYVSFHGNDEFWYSNPPDSYIRMNNLTTGRGHGAYREVFATIDGSFVGSVIPFPIIFTGGINPLFWEPVVAIGAFNVPSYDFDLTPFLGLVLDCKTHLFGLGVADSIPFWLVDANLHLWLSHGSSAINAKSVHTHTPSLSIKRSSVFDQLDGSFEIRAKRTSRFLGWVKSNEGNLTTLVLHHLNFKNSIRFERNGTYKLVRQKVKTKTEVKVESEMGLLIGRVRIKRRYPLRVITSTLPGSRSNVYKMVTNVSHSLTEKLSCGCFSRSLLDSQDSRGWMVVKDHDVLSGSANTDQSFSYMDEFGCYSRVVSATDGKLVSDNMTFSCPSSF